MTRCKLTNYLLELERTGPYGGNWVGGLNTYNTKTFRNPALDLLGGSRATHGVPDEEPRVMGRLIDCAVLP